MPKAPRPTNTWAQEDVESGNCVKERWSRKSSGLEAEVTRTKEGIQGIIKAAEDMARAKKKGELILTEFGSIDGAKEVLDQLMKVITETEAPHKGTKLAPRVSNA